MVADIFIGFNFYIILEQEGRNRRTRKNYFEYNLGHARVGKLTDKI